jgi:hypothetical protein
LAEEIIGGPMKSLFWRGKFLRLLFPVCFVISIVVAAQFIVFASRAVAAPGGTRTVKDFTGACQASVPANWVQDKDFTIVREVPSIVASRFGAWMVPMMGFGQSIRGRLSLVGGGGGGGPRFRMRVARMDVSTVCALQRERIGSDFSPAERDQLKEVGETLEILP